MAEEKPLVEGRAFVRIEDFCRDLGAERPTVESLLVSGELDGLLDERGRPFGLFADALPDREGLEALALTVSETYDPDAFGPHVDDTPDPDEPVDPGSSSWFISW